MTTKTAKKEPVFTPAEIEEKRKKMVEETLGIKPVGIEPEGYVYNGPETTEAILKYAKEKKKK